MALSSNGTLPHPLVAYYAALNAVKERQVKYTSFESMFEQLKELRIRAVDDNTLDEIALVTLLTSDLLSALHPQLLQLVLQRWRLRLKSSSLALLQPAIIAELPSLLASLPNNPKDL